MGFPVEEAPIYLRVLSCMVSCGQKPASLGVAAVAAAQSRAFWNVPETRVVGAYVQSLTKDMSQGFHLGSVSATMSSSGNDMSVIMVVASCN